MNAVSIDVDMLDSLPAKTMLKLVEKRQATMKYLNEVGAAIQQQSSLFRFFEEQDIDIRLDPNYCHVSVSFTGTGDKLRLAWGELRRHGYKCSSRPQKGETSFASYWEQDGRPKLFMHFSSSVCKRVQIGTKTVEQPIYETQCDEIPGIELLEAAPPPALPAPEEIPF